MRIATPFVCASRSCRPATFSKSRSISNSRRCSDDAAVFVTGEVQQVFHDALETAGFAIDRLEIAIAALGVERDLGHAQRFDVSAHRGQRRFQFM